MGRIFTEHLQVNTLHILIEIPFRTATLGNACCKPRTGGWMLLPSLQFVRLISEACNTCLCRSMQA